MLIKKDRLEFQLGRYFGGVEKRIDENLEILQLILNESPNIVIKQPWIIGWFVNTDRFLVSLHPLLVGVYRRERIRNPKKWEYVNQRRIEINQKLDLLAELHFTPFPLLKEDNSLAIRNEGGAF